MPSRSSNHRSRSRADSFLDALEGGHVREALDTLKPSSHSHSRGSDRHGPNHHHDHRHRHHETRAYDYYDEGPPRRSRADEVDHYYSYDPRGVPDGNNNYYYYDGASPAPQQQQRRHRSAHSGRHHHHHRHDYDDERRGRSSHSHGHGHSHRRSASSYGGVDIKGAVVAAGAAGAMEAWRSRHDANRTMRVATAALGAAATDSALGTRHHNEHKKEKRHVVESALAGLAENRLINGPRR